MGRCMVNSSIYSVKEVNEIRASFFISDGTR